MSIGERIKQARKANKFSLRKLAEEIGVSAMAISKYERDLNVPGSEILIQLSRALGVNLDFFFRPSTVSVELQAYRKHAGLGIKEQEAIQMRIQDWAERYLEVESFFPEERLSADLPQYRVTSLEDVENAAIKLRDHWHIGYDSIENLVQLLEDRGIKVGTVSGFEHFDACTFHLEGSPVIVTKSEIPGDRQRFNLGHELGHLALDIQGDLMAESAANRFVGAFLVPARIARYELGTKRTELNINELDLLKHKYGLSMQAWIYRARDLFIISESTASRLFQRFRINNWHRIEPRQLYPSEAPMRMERLVYRALAEDLISRSRAQELLEKTLISGSDMETN